MPYRVTILPAAVRQLSKLSTVDQRRIASKIDMLADNPRPPDSRKLAGADRLYRLRVGDCRVVYEILEKQLVVLVIRVGHRREVYRGL